MLFKQLHIVKTFTQKQFNTKLYLSKIKSKKLKLLLNEDKIIKEIRYKLVYYKLKLLQFKFIV